MAGHVIGVFGRKIRFSILTHTSAESVHPFAHTFLRSLVLLGCVSKSCLPWGLVLHLEVRRIVKEPRFTDTPMPPL